MGNLVKLIPDKREAAPGQLVIDVFTNAVIKTLAIQCSYAVVAGKAYACTDPQKIPAKVADIAAVLGLVGNQVNGAIAICYGKQIYLALIGAILGKKFQEIPTDLEDGAGEILNMIFGAAKAELDAEHGYSFQSAIPTIIRGPNLQFNTLATNSRTAIPFTGKDGTFEIRISLSREIGK